MLKNNIKISVIIPVYNVEKYLDKCLTSIINQSLKDIEIICINDGSTDSSLQILESYKEKDNRIIIINQKNLKQAAARNNGLKIAKGEYISFVDSDDYIEKDFLKKLYQTAINNNADIAASNVQEFIDDDFFYDISYVSKMTFFFYEKRILVTPEDKFGIIYSCSIWNKIYRREFLTKNNISFFENLFLEDVSFNQISTILANKIILVKDVYYYYSLSNPNSFMKLTSIKKETIDMINMTKSAKLFLLTRLNKDSLDTKKYFEILDSFEIYNLEGWYNSIHKNYKNIFYKKLREIFEKLDISNNKFVFSNSREFYNKVIKYKNLNEFRYNQKIIPIDYIYSKMYYQNYKVTNLLGFKITKKINKQINNTFNPNKLKAIIEEHSVISFDIFDTMLLRPYANPKNVFQHLEELYDAQGFSEIRANAEREYTNLYGQKYVNYDEIYKVIPDKFKFLKEKEIEIEKNTIYINNEMLEFFNYAKSLGKKIIFLTDMYFSSTILKTILEKNGVIGDYDIYVSAENRKAKYDKTLFEYVISKLNITPKSILHIGNNIHSDYNMAVESHINAYHYIEPMYELFNKYPKIQYFYNNTDCLTSGIIVGLLVKKFLESGSNEIDYWKYFGYFIGGPVCYGLTKFIYDEIKNNNIKDVIFVARDGYTIEKIFKLFDNTIKTDYIYAPRILNLLINIDYQNKLPWENKINSLIYTLKIMDKELNLNLDINYNIDKDRFIEQNYRTIKELSNEIRDLYLKYISKFNIKDKNIGLFDISGGNFSSLKIIRNIFPNSNIYGLYWQIADEADRTGILCKSYVENFNNPIKNYELLEFLITAPE
ncbi:glycosyltransferase, partial [Brachyspira intermedia]|uniref:glycosyltransferase n=1 Tax=Brachyspira intermedia TaxID=84377 RepID=UPI003004F2E1